MRNFFVVGYLSEKKDYSIEREREREREREMRVLYIVEELFLGRLLLRLNFFNDSVHFVVAKLNAQLYAIDYAMSQQSTTESKSNSKSGATRLVFSE